MMWSYYLCIIYATLWSTFALRMQTKLGYPVEKWRVALVLAANFLFAPICMLIAIVVCPVNSQHNATEHAQ